MASGRHKDDLSRSIVSLRFSLSLSLSFSLSRPLSLSLSFFLSFCFCCLFVISSFLSLPQSLQMGGFKRIKAPHGLIGAWPMRPSLMMIGYCAPDSQSLNADEVTAFASLIFFSCAPPQRHLAVMVPPHRHRLSPTRLPKTSTDPEQGILDNARVHLVYCVSLLNA